MIAELKPRRSEIAVLCDAQAGRRRAVRETVRDLHIHSRGRESSPKTLPYRL